MARGMPITGMKIARNTLDRAMTDSTDRSKPPLVRARVMPKPTTAA